jgi:hypothetical protein
MRQQHSHATILNVQFFLAFVRALKVLRPPNLPFFLGMILAQVSCLPASGKQASAATGPVPSTDSNRTSIAKNYGKLPLSFEANQGQSDPQVRFLSRGNGYSLFLTDKEAVLALQKPEKMRSAASLNPAQAKPGERSTASFRSDVVRMQLAGASPDVHVIGADKLPGAANYFIGNDPTRWHSGVATFGKVEYEDVYPGVDLVYYGNKQQLEYDFVVAPYADTKLIHLRFAGAKKLKLDPNGDLEIIARNGRVAFHRPVAYQEKDGTRLTVNGRFTLLAGGEAGFAIESYDRAKPLVIDPTLSYSTYLGGSNGSSYGTAIAVDSSGNAYVTGVVYATDFPSTSGAYQTSNDKSASTFDAFVAKLNPTGTALVYATYLGGSGNTSVAGTLNHGDYPTGIRVDSSGETYIAGIAYSVDFPVTAGVLQGTNRGGANGVSNGFVTKINAAGSGLVYSTYLGGSGLSGYAGQASLSIPSPGGDGCASIAIDASGDAYLTGTAYSTDFPVTSAAYQATNKSASTGRPNAFVTKLNPQGSALDYSTYLGGSIGDGGSGIAVDSGGNAYIDGATYSSDFPLTGSALQSANLTSPSVGSNGFVAKLNSTGSSLVYSTYLGGSGNANGPSGNNNGDAALSIALDSTDNAYVFGLTASQDFPVTGDVLQSVNKAFAVGAPDYFIAKVNPLGSGLVYSTYLGGSQPSLSPGSNGLALDSSGDAYVTGYVLATDFPVSSNAYQSSPTCALVTSGSVTEYTSPVFSEINPSGTALLYSTYFGGTGGPVSVVAGVSSRTCDYGYGLGLDSEGNAYLTGSAVSANFPTTSGAFQTSNPANGSSFVSKFLLNASATSIATTTSLAASGNPASVGTSVTFTATVNPGGGNGVPTGTVTFNVDGGSGTAVALNGSGNANYSTGTLTAGTHTIEVSYSGDANYAASSDSLTETITGAAANIAVASGSGQSATIGTAFAAPLVVLVKDANGNPVSGVSVTFTGTSLNFANATAATGSGGTASTTATPSATGTLTATASTIGVSTSAVFTLTGVASTTPAGSGMISTYAGNGTAGYSGDDGPALDAAFQYPYGVAVDSSGNLYIADKLNNAIRKVTSSGTISTYAGNGTLGYSGDGGQARDAKLNNPGGLALDSNGNLYIADTENNVVREVSPAGIISTVAGNGSGGFSGDQGPATSAELLGPSGVTVDASGDLYIADSVNNRIRVVSNGVIKTIAGNGNYGFSGDGGPAVSAELATPYGVALDTGGKLYIADYLNNRIRIVSASGVITTYAGNGTEGYSGDNGPATSAELFYPSSVALDKSGNLYISDIYNQRIRMVTSQGIIHTVAGDGTAGFGGDGGSATLAELNHPAAVALDSSGNLYIADANNQRVRVVGSSTPAVETPVFSPPGGSYSSAQSVTIMDSTPGATIYYTTDGTTPTTSSTEYSGAFMVDSSATIEAIAVAPGYSNSAVATAAYTINLPPTAATPTFSPVSGTYTSAQSVTISDATTSAKIYYTTDGSTPGTGSILYSAPIAVSATETIEAIAAAPGYTSSAVASAAYTINIPPPTVATPVFSPTAGTYTSAQSVTITDSTSGAAIYYTMDGSTPTTSSARYNSAITFGSTETIKAVATASGDTNSAVASATYTINLPAPAFTLAASPTSTTISSGQSATFTLTVTPQNGFNQAVSFSCSGLPSGDTCSFTPSTITPSAAAVNSTMTISPSASATGSRSLPWEKAATGLVLALLLWPFGRRRLSYRLSIVLLLLVGLIAAGCGGRPKSQNYSVSIAASGGGVSQTSSVSLTINR